MNLRTKSILFFGAIILAITASIIFYIEYATGNTFKKQATNNLRIIAEQSEAAYLSFVRSMEVRVIDWTSDNTIRGITKNILNTKEDPREREKLAKEFADYVSTKKMPYDRTVINVDLLDKNGIIIASTKSNRIGLNEKEEGSDRYRTHDFDATIDSNFGEAFWGSFVLDENDYPEPTTSISARMFNINTQGEIQPMDAVLLVYFSNTAEIAEILGSGTSVYAAPGATTKRLTNRTLLENYRTSNLYLVNNERYLVTPTRDIRDVKIKQKVDTLPVKECLENGKEISAEYDNYRGVHVIGASMCFPKEGTVILIEIEKEEISAPITELVRNTIIACSLIFLVGILVIVVFLKNILARIKNIMMTAGRIASGDLDARVKNIGPADEIGYLGAVFNTMVSKIYDDQKMIQQAKNNAEKEKAYDEALLASIGEGVTAVDQDGKITLINRTAEKMLGLKAAEVLGKKAEEVLIMFDENKKEISREEYSHTIKKVPSVEGGSVFYKKKDDGYFPIAITSTPIIFEDKKLGSIAVFHDVTREKEMEDARQDLLSLASHQLRTPLSGTKWLIETLKKGIHGSLTEKQTEYIDELYKINERMTSLVYGMLDIVRMGSSKTEAEKKPVSIKSAFDPIIEALNSAATKKQINIRLPENFNYTVNTNLSFLKNIFEAIISNAINYSKPQSEIVITAEKTSSELIVAIKDSGIGIPKDEQSQIFERFYRASNAKTFDTRGSGLGLYAAKMLARKIGVQISFESAEEAGTTFFVHIPISNSQQGDQEPIP